MIAPALRFAVLLGLALASPVAADTVETIIQDARETCDDLENGVFDPQDAVVSLDLTGNGEADRLIDTGRFACSSAASLYCGSGGCLLHAVVGEESWEFQAEAWRVIDWDGRPILLIARDGGWCGGSGAQICFEAVSWSHGQMMTVMPPMQ